MDFSFFSETDFYIKILIATVIFLGSFPVSFMVEKMIRKTMIRLGTERSTIYFTVSSTKIVFKILFFIFSMMVFIDLRIMLATAGTSAAVFGLIFKDMLSNLMSGIMIISNRIFKVEDYLKVGDDEGFVQKVEIFFTTLKTKDEKEIVIPNSVLTSNVVTKLAKF